jgi:hypothetical protein
MPAPLPLTSERLERHGLYLIEDGQTIFLWVGRDAVHQLVKDVFDLPSYADLRGGKVRFVSSCLFDNLPTHNGLSFLGHTPSTGEFVLPARQCCHRQDT